MANDYISRNEVLADIRATIESSGCVNHEREIIDCVRYATSADVIPVVRCKDCKHAGDEIGVLYCKIFRHEIGQAHFCSYGARMDKEVPNAD